MNSSIIEITRLCSLFKKITTEFNKPFGWTKISSKKTFLKEVKRSNIESLIKSLADDRWTVEYLYHLQHTLITFKVPLEKYMGTDFYISGIDDEKEYDPKIFLPMYFKDTERGNMIMMEVIASNITFTIMDGNTGNTFSVSSSDFVQPSQMKIATVCKARLVEMFLALYQDSIYIKPVTWKRIFSDIKSNLAHGGDSK